VSILDDDRLGPKWYTLDENNEPVLTEMLTACKWMAEDLDRRIIEKTKISAEDSVDGVECEVSTVFLCLDHNKSLRSSDRTPVLWETMIFGSTHNDYQERYTSLEKAKIGHKKAVWIARGGLDQEHEQAG